MQPSKARTRRVTLRDVARAAGVSINTASRALNGKPDVSEATRARVQAVAAQLDYRPNQVARGLRQQKTATLGVVSGVRFTAVACFSDYVSFGAIRALRQAKLRIPEDVAVIGYDDIDLAAIVEPALTTVHIAKTRLGQVAAHMLLGMIGSSSTDQPQVGLTVLPPQLVIRESS